MSRSVHVAGPAPTPPEQTAEPRLYLPALDGLRALAVAAVIAYHLHPAWLPGGMLGVAVFFVLSGYLITDLLADQWRREGRIDLRAFWARRARRLLPALAVVLTAVAAWVTLTRPAELPALRADVLAAVCYVSNWWFILHHVPYFARFGPVSPLGNLWSLAVEEQFYLLWPLLLYAGLRRTPRRGRLAACTLGAAAVSALAMALVYHPGTNPTRVYDGTDTRAFSLLIGAAAALVWPSREWVARSWHWALEAAGGLGLLVVLWMFAATDPYQTLLYRGGMVGFSLGAAALVLAAAHPRSRIGGALSWRPLRWLGERSYGIYLWHYPIIVLTTPAAPAGGAGLARGLAQVGASVALAALSYRYIERPVRRDGLRSFVRSLRKTPPRQWRPVATVALAAAVGLLTIATSGLAGMVPAAAHAATDPRPAGYQRHPAGRLQATTPSSPASPTTPAATTPPAAASTLAARHIRRAKAGMVTDAPTCPTVTAIGDSVLLDTVPYLKRAVPGVVIDGRVGRQLYQGAAVVARLRAKRRLGACTVIELGTNGPFTTSQLRGLLRELRGKQRIVLVNTRVPRPWEPLVNRALARAAATFPRTVLVHWHAASAHHPAYFRPDGVHLNPAGARRLAALIRQALGRAEPTASSRTAGSAA